MPSRSLSPASPRSSTVQSIAWRPSMKLSLRNGRRNHISTSCTPGRRLGIASTLRKSVSAKAIRRWTNVPCSCCVSSDRSCFSIVKRMAPLSCRSSRRSGNVHGTDRNEPRANWKSRTGSSQCGPSGRIHHMNPHQRSTGQCRPHTGCLFHFLSCQALAAPRTFLPAWRSVCRKAPPTPFHCGPSKSRRSSSE